MINYSIEKEYQGVVDAYEKAGGGLLCFYFYAINAIFTQNPVFMNYKPGWGEDPQNTQNATRKAKMKQLQC